MAVPFGKITIVGNLTPVGGTAARITPEEYETAQALDGAITGGTPQNYKKFTVTPKDGVSYRWEIGRRRAQAKEELTFTFGHLAKNLR